MWANMLRAFQVGKAFTSPPEPVESDAVLAGGLGPGELADMPFDEGLGFRRDAEVLVEAGGRLADLGVSALDEQPVTLAARAAAERETDDDASTRKPVSAERVAHRPQGHEGIEVHGSGLESTVTFRGTMVVGYYRGLPIFIEPLLTCSPPASVFQL